MKKFRAESTCMSAFNLAFFSCYCLLPFIVSASQPSERLVPRLKGYLKSPYGYWEYLPANYDEAAKHPVVIYLHGIKETGSGESYAELDKVVRNGVPLIIRKYARDFPFILIAPQSPGIKEGFAVEHLEDLIQLIQTNYNIDEDRIYITGVSYGAYAALRLASVIPNKFAAIVPFSSCGGENNLNNLRDVPMWAFVNALDKKEVPECMQQLIVGIRDHGGTPLLTLYPRKGHNAWERTYKSEFMWDWLLKQKRTRRNENQPPMLIHPGNKTVGIGALARYTIMASDANNDSLQFRVEGPITPGSHFKIVRNGHAELTLNTLFPGTFNISIVVDDGRGGTSSQSFFLKTNYNLLLFPYLLLFMLQPILAEFPNSVVFIFLILMELLTSQFINLVTQVFYWLSVLILAIFGIK